MAWLGAGLAFLQYLQLASNIGEVEYVWPHPAVITASALAPAASLLTVLSLPLAIPVWREAGWGWRRRVATAVFALALTLLLGRCGFLAPWSS